MLSYEVIPISTTQATLSLNFQQGGPIPHNHLTIPLMVRQPYSEAVKSDGRSGFLFFPEGRRPRREVEPSLMGKSDANECNENSLSNCRVQPALSIKEGRDDFRKSYYKNKN